MSIWCPSKILRGWNLQRTEWVLPSSPEFGESYLLKVQLFLVIYGFYKSIFIDIHQWCNGRRYMPENGVEPHGPAWEDMICIPAFWSPEDWNVHTYMPLWDIGFGISMEILPTVPTFLNPSHNSYLSTWSDYVESFAFRRLEKLIRHLDIISNFTCFYWTEFSIWKTDVRNWKISSAWRDIYI